MVRLLQEAFKELLKEGDEVSVPQWCDCCEGYGRYEFDDLERFNPTMVRLLLAAIFRAFMRSPVSIPQWCDCCYSWPLRSPEGLLQFQSHNGAIAANNTNYKRTLMKRFNPTMVRLLLTLHARLSAKSLTFQSHNGAIAARIIQVACGKIRVSIPQWCDCCELGFRLFLSVATSFNPTMVRLLRSNN